MMELDMARPAPPASPMQPMLLFDMDAEHQHRKNESTTLESPSADTNPEKIDPLMPVLRETPPPENNFFEALYSTQQPLPDNSPEFFNLDVPDMKSPAIDFDLTAIKPVLSPKSDIISGNGNPQNQFGLGEMASKASSIYTGRALSKPSQIYAEPKQNNPLSAPPEENMPMRYAPKDETPAIEMKLVEREDIRDNEHIQAPKQVHLATSNPAEMLASQLESEELKRRTNERISKLRNLSFNLNAADPNNDFETIPAYLRRPVDIQNQTTDVENFYSNYTVKSDDNNQAEIGVINNYLSGKRPD
jgi:cell division protein FtsZ